MERTQTQLQLREAVGLCAGLEPVPGLLTLVESFGLYRDPIGNFETCCVLVSIDVCAVYYTDVETW